VSIKKYAQLLAAFITIKKIVFQQSGAAVHEIFNTSQANKLRSQQIKVSQKQNQLRFFSLHVLSTQIMIKYATAAATAQNNPLCISEAVLLMAHKTFSAFYIQAIAEEK
jgi:hypothetical protein